ncbi:formate dehydrogenase accessory sulfurtransferase FdhD [Micromonospora sp. WMMA1363]|uniref:formate dehydrogenase accessory sulfurtransferase FdhD n=1 Tax=Micromonospora sp. WMMA1363 TaxID=3053985 RepID=UPI00259CEA5B|nr:formate dehydrogenase accessory sulfurtransferase FdhD [Micromonospora sp. WMMA1363]MDM4723408.1 formate dehydrogenase accessory sulfurtransferase FdhD [Micromonospora sp. WMMA1363]
MGRATDRRGVLRIDLDAADDRTSVQRRDTLAVEEPLEIRVGPAGPGRRRPLAVTMRTPGDDLDLAVGFLLTEGLIRSADDVRTAQLCAGAEAPNTYNVVDVVLAPDVRSQPSTRPVLLHDQFLRRVRQGEHRRRADPVALRCDPRSAAGARDGPG